MLFGFAVKAEGGGRNFGVVSTFASRNRLAAVLANDLGVNEEDIEIFDDLEELIDSQYGGLAFLTTAG